MPAMTLSCSPSLTGEALDALQHALSPVDQALAGIENSYAMAGTAVPTPPIWMVASLPGSLMSSLLPASCKVQLLGQPLRTSC